MCFNPVAVIVYMVTSIMLYFCHLWFNKTYSDDWAEIFSKYNILETGLVEESAFVSSDCHRTGRGSEVARKSPLTCDISDDLIQEKWSCFLDVPLIASPDWIHILALMIIIFDGPCCQHGSSWWYDVLSLLKDCLPDADSFRNGLEPKWLWDTNGCRHAAAL